MDVKIVIQKCGGKGSSSQDFAGVLLIIFKTKSSVTGSKVCQGSPVKESSEETVGFGGGKLFLMVRIFSVKYSEKTFGRSSESKAAERSNSRRTEMLSLSRAERMSLTTRNKTVLVL